MSKTLAGPQLLELRDLCAAVNVATAEMYFRSCYRPNMTAEAFGRVAIATETVRHLCEHQRFDQSASSGFMAQFSEAEWMGRIMNALVSRCGTNNVPRSLLDGAFSQAAARDGMAMARGLMLFANGQVQQCFSLDPS